MPGAAPPAPGSRLRAPPPPGLPAALVSASALGVYELRLNGTRVGDQILAPEWTNYHKRIQYQTYDLTDKLVQGQNVIGSWLGNGYYKGRVNWPGIPERRCIYGDKLGLILELDIEWSGKERQRLVERWVNEIVR